MRPKVKYHKNKTLLRKISNINALKSTSMSYANKIVSHLALKELTTFGILSPIRNNKRSFKYDKLKANAEINSTIRIRLKSLHILRCLTDVKTCYYNSKFEGYASNNDGFWIIAPSGTGKTTMVKNLRDAGLIGFIDGDTLMEWPKTFRWFETMDEDEQTILGVNHIDTLLKVTMNGEHVLFNPNLKSLMFAINNKFMRAKIVMWIEDDERHLSRLRARSKFKPDQPTDVDFKGNDEYRLIAEKYHIPIITNVYDWQDFSRRLYVLDSKPMNFWIGEEQIERKVTQVALYTLQLTGTNFKNVVIEHLPDIFNVPTNKKVSRPGEVLFDRQAFSWLVRNEFKGSVNASVYNTRAMLNKAPFYVLNPLYASSIYWPIYDRSLKPIFAITDNHSHLIKYLGRVIKTSSHLVSFRDRLINLKRYYSFEVIDRNKYIIKYSDRMIHVSGHARYILILAVLDIIDFMTWLNAVKFYLYRRTNKVDPSWVFEFELAVKSNMLTEELADIGFEHSIDDLAFGLVSAVISFERWTSKYAKALFLVMISTRILPELNAAIRTLLNQQNLSGK